MCYDSRGWGRLCLRALDDDGDDGDGGGGDIAVPPSSHWLLPPLPHHQILGYFDIAFTSVFTVEIVLKVSKAMGQMALDL